MRKIEVERLFCDCCGKEVDNFYSRFIIPKAFTDFEYEICEECHNKLHQFLESFIKVKRKKDE